MYKDGSFRYYNFIGIIDKEFNPKLNWETKSFEWLTIEELYNLKNKHFGLIALLKNNKKSNSRISK